MASFLITGTSRGFGLYLATILAAKPASKVSKVYATARNQNDDLKKLVAESGGRVEFIQLDVVSADSIKNAAVQVEKSLGDQGLDVLINSAGVLPYTQGGVEKMTDLLDVFKTNVASAQDVTTSLMHLLRKGARKQVINITSNVGTFALQSTFSYMPSPAYKVSKAGLNMLTIQWANDYAAEGFTFVAVAPGWMRTALGGPDAFLSVEQGGDATMEIIEHLTPADNGKFLMVNIPGSPYYTGGSPPW